MKSGPRLDAGADRREAEALSRNIRRLTEMADPELTGFWHLLGYRDAITPEIQRAALAHEVFYLLSCPDGWSFDEEGRRTQLGFDTSFPMVKDAPGETAPLRIGRPREDACPHCGKPMKYLAQKPLKGSPSMKMRWRHAAPRGGWWAGDRLRVEAAHRKAGVGAVLCGRQEEFDGNDSEIGTVVQECIAADVAYIPERSNIPVEEAIRERDGEASGKNVPFVKRTGGDYHADGRMAE